MVKPEPEREIVREAVIVDIARSPIGRAHKGSLTGVRADDLAALVVSALVDRNPGINPAALDDVICGASSGGGEQGFNLGRVVSRLAGLPVAVPGTTVNRFCASSMQAMRMAHHAIAADEGDAFIVVGVEMVSRPRAAFTAEYENPRFTDSSRADFAGEMYLSMGETAERVADRYAVSRDDMDRYAVLSHVRAVAAQDNGAFGRELIEVPTPDGVVSQDDGPRRDTTLDKLAALPPLFRDGGRVTAGNSCPLNDGAAAALVVSAERAREWGLVPRARIVGSHVVGLEPDLMGLGPIEATRALLDRLGMTVADLDVVELNEAFAAQVLPVCQELGLDIDDQLNPFGGAIALGHPFGMTGVRMLGTLLTGLEARDGTRGMATQCIGGGQGMSMVIERTA